MCEYRAVRPTKVAFVQGWYTQYGDRVEIVPLDLTNGDYTTVLKGNVDLFSNRRFVDHCLQVSMESFTRQHLFPEALRLLRKPSTLVQTFHPTFDHALIPTQAGVDGTRRILEQATKAGIKKFSLVSSSIALFNLAQMGTKSSFNDKGRTTNYRFVGRRKLITSILDICRLEYCNG